MLNRIAIDLDNTVADFMAGAIPKMREVFGIEVKQTKKINRIEEAFGLKPKVGSKWDKLGVDKADYETLLNIRKTLYIEGRLFRDLPLIEEKSWELTEHLSAKDTKVYFITARTRHPTIVSDTHHWLQNNNFYYDDVFFVDDKAALCEYMDIPLILDDEPGQITSCLSRGINVIAMAQDWNENLSAPTLVEGYEKLGRFARTTSLSTVASTIIKWGL